MNRRTRLEYQMYDTNCSKKPRWKYFILFSEEQVNLKSDFENQTSLLLLSFGLISTNQIGQIKDRFENQTALIKESFENQTALLKEDTENENHMLNHILEHSHNIEDYVKGTITSHQQIEGKIE